MKDSLWILLAALVGIGFAVKAKGKTQAKDEDAAHDPPEPGSVDPPTSGETETAPADVASEMKAALAGIVQRHGTDIARKVEKVYRLETADFTSGLFLASNGAGQKAFTLTYPWGWPRRGTVASDYGEPVEMVDTGEGAPSWWVVYRKLETAANYLAQFIVDHKGNAARWNSVEAARQAVYQRLLDGKPTPWTDEVAAQVFAGKPIAQR